MQVSETCILSESFVLNIGSAFLSHPPLEIGTGDIFLEPEGSGEERLSRVGKDIAALCTKCKMVLTHVVVSEVDGTVSKVQCKTCGSVHRYRNGGGEKSSGTRSARTAKLIKPKSGSGAQAPPKELQRRWQMKRDAMTEGAEIKDYRIDSEYGAEDIVRHATFGLGFVERVFSRTRVEILFEKGMKLMAMNTRT